MPNDGLARLRLHWSAMRWSLLVLCVAGCFSKPADVDFDASPFDARAIDGRAIDANVDAPAPDAIVPDAVTECPPSTIICDDATSTYVDCDATGTPTFSMHCPLGCSTNSEKCVDVDPSNGLAAQLDLARDDGATVAFSGNSTIDTTTGVVFNGANSITVPSAPVNGMRVFRFKSLSVAGTLRVTGNDMLAIVVDGDVTIAGVLDVSSDWSSTGIAGPGADPTFAAATVTTKAGTGGGGNHQVGAHGGDFTGGPAAGGAGGAGQSDPDLVPLRAGMAGGTSMIVGTIPGGLGGGAVQIVSRTTISVLGSGVIDASGAGGSANTILVTPGVGGGAGGTVLLEAPQLTLDGAGVVVSTKGGGGSDTGFNGCTTCQGSDGGYDAAAAPGGTGAAAGGNGGTGATAPTVGSNGASAGGGGGGSVGEARFNTTAGTINPQNGAAIRSAFSTGLIATRLVP